MQILKQSTQVNVHIGPVVAVGDGYTPVTNLDVSTADEAEILKAGATTTTDISAATFTAITNCDGYYYLTLTTSHTDTCGTLTVCINDDSLCLPVMARFQVVEEAIYDSLFGASAAGFDSNQRVDVGEWLGTAVTLSTNNKPDVNVDEWGDVALATTDPLPNAVAGASGGLLIAGTNAATTFSTASGSALTITTSADADALTISGTGTNSTGIQIEATGTGDGVHINSPGSGAGVNIDSAAGFGVDVSSSGASAVYYYNSSSGYGLNCVSQSGDAAAITSLGGVAKTGLHLRSDGTGARALEISAVSGGTGVYFNTGSTDIDGVIDVTAISGSTTAADNLELSALQIVPGNVSNAVTPPTTTLIPCDTITDSTADHYVGRVIVFTSGAMQYEAAPITDYALVSGEGRFTVKQMTRAPSNGDDFIVV